MKTVSIKKTEQVITDIDKIKKHLETCLPGVDISDGDTLRYALIQTADSLLEHKGEVK